MGLIADEKRFQGIKEIPGFSMLTYFQNLVEGYEGRLTPEQYLANLLTVNEVYKI